MSKSSRLQGLTQRGGQVKPSHTGAFLDALCVTVFVKKVGGGVENGGFGGSYPKKICKLMCNHLRTLRIGRYAPAISAILSK